MLKTQVASGPTYHIQIFRTGTCRVLGRHSYGHWGQDQDHRFDIYVTVIKGNGLTAIVDTGMDSVAEMNRGAGFLMSEVITQGPGEDTVSILEKAEVKGEEVNYVFLTHCHYDHCSLLRLFPKATVVIPEHGWKVWHEQPKGAIYLHAGFLAELEEIKAQGRLLLLDEGVVVPGIGVRWVGGHCPCSQFVYVNTDKGVAMLTGDTVQMYGNLEHNDIIGIREVDEECWRAIEIAREADVFLPGHDPRVLERYPDGIVA